MAQGGVWLVLTVTLFLFVFCQNVSSFRSDLIKSDNRTKEIKPLLRRKRFPHQLIVPVQGIALVNGVVTTEEEKNRTEITPLIRRKRQFGAAVQGIALATGVVTSGLQIADYAVGGHLYAWSIPKSTKRILAAQAYMEGKKDKIETLSKTYKNTYTEYENSYIYYNKYQRSRNILMDLIDNAAIDVMRQTLFKDGMRAYLLENGVKISDPESTNWSYHILNWTGMSAGVLQNVIIGQSLFKHIAIHKMKMKDLNIAFEMNNFNGQKTSVVHQINPKISSNPKYRAESIKAARAKPSFDTIDAQGNFVRNKFITVLDENGVVQEYMTEKAGANMRSKYLKAQGIKEICTTSLTSKIFSKIKGAFKLSSKYLASKNPIKFDPNTGRNTEPLRVSKAATSLAVLSIGLQVSGLTITILNQQKSAEALEKQARQIEANKKEVDNLLDVLPKDITAMEIKLEEMVGIVDYLLESEKIKCDLTRDNLLPVLREIANNAEKRMKHVVANTENYKSIEFQIQDNLRLGGKEIYEKISLRYPDMKSEIIKMLRDRGLANFKWTDWSPLPGQDGKCITICGILQRKIRRSCMKGNCFGTERATEICQPKIFDQEEYEKCSTKSSRIDNSVKGVGDFLPVVCKSHLEFKNHVYYILVNEDSGLALTIDKKDPISLITTSKTSGDNELWRLEDGYLVCKYLGRTLGSGLDKWKYNSANMRIENLVDTEKMVLGIFPCENTRSQSQNAISEVYSEQSGSCQKWRMEEFKPLPATTTTPSPITTTSKPQTMEPWNYYRSTWNYLQNHGIFFTDSLALKN